MTGNNPITNDLRQSQFRLAVREQMTRQGFSQAALAKRCGMAVSTLNVWLAGRQEASPSNLETIAQVLGLELRAAEKMFPVRVEQTGIELSEATWLPPTLESDRTE